MPPPVFNPNFGRERRSAADSVGLTEEAILLLCAQVTIESPRNLIYSTVSWPPQHTFFLASICRANTDPPVTKIRLAENSRGRGKRSRQRTEARSELF